MSRLIAHPCLPSPTARPRVAECIVRTSEAPARAGSGRMVNWLGAALVGLGATIGWLGVGRDVPPSPAIPPGGVDSHPAAELPIAVVDFPGDPPRDADRGVGEPVRDHRIDAAIRQARSSSVSIEYVAEGPVPTRRVASGVVINDQGDLLSIRIDSPTPRGGPPIIATDAQGHRHQVRWLAADPETGLTLLRLPPGALPPVRLAANDAALGAEVFLVSNPYGLGHSISRGHVGGLGRRLNMAGRAVAGLIQVQAPIHPGDSGAPLADLNGGWLGLVRGGLELPNPGLGRGDDLAFVIPARDALWVADQLRASGRVDRAYLGLRFVADAALKSFLIPPPRGLPTALAEPGSTAGATVKEVLPGSPAAQARLQAGDRVVRIDGRPIAGTIDLADRLEQTAAGAQVALDYIRGGAPGRITLRAGSRPARPAPTSTSTASVPALASTPPLPTTPDAAPASSPDPLIQSLLVRINQLEQRIGDLERERGRPGPR